MNKEHNYYKILGIKEGSSQDEVKKAYKKLAVKCHPDKGGNVDTFKNITEAYGVLVDEEKKAVYDQYGIDGLKNYENTVSMRNSRISKLEPLVVEVVCNLGELYNGTQKKVTVERFILEGNMKNHHTLKKILEEEDFLIDIEPFTLYGQKMVYQGKGHKHKIEDIMGDLIFVVVSHSQQDNDSFHMQLNNQENEEYKGYTLEGLDLHYKLHISLKSALTGFESNIEFLDGKIGLISSSKIVKPETVKVIHGKGFVKNMRTPMGIIPKQGDLYIHFIIEFPEKLNPKQIKQISIALNTNIPNNLKTEKTDKNLIFEVEKLDDPSEKNDNQQQFMFSPGSMSGMSGMSSDGQECTVM